MPWTPNAINFLRVMVGCAVGRAQVLHPGGEMTALLMRRDWPIWHWQQEKTMISPGHSRGETKIQPMEGHA
jgi:hypothetical protein